MREFLTAAILAFPAMTDFGRAQTANYSHHEGNSITYNIASINQRSFFLERSTPVGPCCQDIAYVVCVTSGTFTARNPIAVNAWLKNGRVKSTFDQHVIAVIGTDFKGCDYGGYNYHIAKLDTLCNVIFNISLSHPVMDIVPWSDGSFYYTNGTSMYHYSAAGQYLSAVSLGSVAITSMAHLMNDKILLSYSDASGARFRIIDTAGTNIYDVASSQTFSKISQSPDGSIYALGGGRLMRFDPSLLLMYSSASTLSSSVSITDYDWKNDSLFVTGKYNPVTPLYMILSNSLNTIYQAPTNVENAYGTGIIIGNDSKVNIITTGATSLSPSHNFGGYFSLPQNGSIISTPDIGVTSFTALSAYFSNMGAWIVGNANLLVTVRNFGSQPVTEFKLNHYVYVSGTSYCLIGLQKSFTATIMPGDSAQVTTGMFYNTPMSHYTFTASTVPVNLCVHTTVPDKLNDQDVSNDHLCRSVNFIVTDLDESYESAPLSCYPNPSSGNLNVRSSFEIESVSLHNLQGAVILESRIQAQECELKDLNLSPGLYFIRINYSMGSVLRRIVID
jgi:hypothetical protein